MASPLAISRLFDVTGLVVVIAGGGSGLGAYAAKALDANGAKAVYIIGRREDSLKKTAADGTNGKIIPLVGDVTKRESLAAIVQKVTEAEGYINVLFANAGVVGPRNRDYFPAKDGKLSVEEFRDAMLEIPAEDFTQTFDVNVTAVFFTAVAFLGLLDAGNKRGGLAQSSQILVTSSIGGFNRSVSAGFAYGASKAAVTFMCKSMTTQFADYNIRVNVVAPGFYPSEMTADTLQGNRDYVSDVEGAFEGAFTVPSSIAPARRTGSEQDFAGAVLYLFSPAGAYINGNVLITDGGRLSALPSSY